jgi:hypothetical protein
VVTDDAMSIELHDTDASLIIGAQWDPDHDCWYSYARFAPDEALSALPFVPDPEPG